MSPERRKKYLFVALGVLACLAIYEIFAVATNFTLIPELFQALGMMFSFFGDGLVMASLGWSLLRLLISFIAAAIVGIVLGILAGYFDSFAHFMAPLITILRAIPTIALLFILVVYVPNFSLYIVFILLFPIIYQATLEGAGSVYRKYEYDLRLNGRWSINNITKVIFPLSQDYILLGLIQAFGLGFKGEIMAETFSYKAGYLGLGRLIYLAYENVETERLVALTLLSLFFSLIMDALLYFIRDKLEAKIGISKKKGN